MFIKWVTTGPDRGPGPGLIGPVGGPPIVGFSVLGPVPGWTGWTGDRTVDRKSPQLRLFFLDQLQCCLACWLLVSALGLELEDWATGERWPWAGLLGKSEQVKNEL